MDQGYKKIFWGLFFVTFHLNIGFLQLLPPFVGWMIFVSGVGELDESLDNSSISTESFKRGRSFGKILVTITLVGFISTIASNGTLLDSAVFLYYPILIIMLEAITVFYILEGTYNVFVALGFEEKEKETKRKLRTYLVIVLTSAVILTFALFFNHDSSSIIGILLGVVAVIYLLISINKLKKFWETDPLRRMEQWEKSL